MTEDEWLSCSDPKVMLCFLLGTSHHAMRQSTPQMRTSRVSDRKSLLFAVGCFDRLHDILPHGPALAAVEVARQFADGQVGADVFRQVGDEVQLAATAFNNRYLGFSASEKTAAIPEFGTLTLAMQVVRPDHGLAAWYSCSQASWTAGAVASSSGLPMHPVFSRVEADEKRAQSQLLAELVGPVPFRPVHFESCWRTSTVVSLAQNMYESRDFSAMPILADALQDAGCEDDNVLSHCRGPGPHVRGCWVCDLVLGKK